MKNLKNNKGITLIALIITIVVLLILAVVAIGQAQDSNIVGYAQNASTKYDEAKGNEIDLLSQYETQIENILRKDRIYSFKDENGYYYIKINEDNTVEVRNALGEKFTESFEYVAVTSAIIENINNNTDSKVSENISDYSRAMKFTSTNGVSYVLLSKDEKILYYRGLPFTLDNNPIKSEEPFKEKVYSAIFNGGTLVCWIQTEETKGILAIEEGYILVAYNVNILDNGKLEQINKYSQATIVTNGYEYSKLGTSSLYNLVYCTNIGKWILVAEAYEHGVLTEVKIESENILEPDSTITQEKINEYKAAAK